MQVTYSWMDSSRHVISNGRWYATWFLMVEELWPHEVGSPEEWLRSPKQLQSH
jgi:hypothetical protein